MKMRHILIAMTVFAVCAAGEASAAPSKALVREQYTSIDTTAMGVTVTDAALQRNGDLMTVTMNLGLADLQMKGDRAIVYAPVLRNGSDSLVLPPVGLYGRTRWIQYNRNGRLPFGMADETSMQYSHRPGQLAYNANVPFSPWMQNAVLELRRCDYGCCNHLLSEESTPLARWDRVEYTPVLRYARPIGKGEKHYELEKQSFIDFPVDQTVIYPEYRRNTIELDSIRRTIDVVRLNPDATIETIWLKGFASPESPYKHNTELAIGRTEALKEYIRKLYNFEGTRILTDYEPEDWEGLRKRVVEAPEGELAHRDQILAIIDSNLEPDPKEWKIKSTYPEDYRFMLQNYYPPLRHTNYKVSYTIRSYSDPVEILKVMKTHPEHLSLDEYYIAASSLEPGTPEFDEVFRTAVRMYPDDQAANLNAANSAIALGDYTSAGRFLDRAGNSADAEYARCILAALEGNYVAATDYLNRAEAAGLVAPEDELAQLREAIAAGNK